MPWTIDDLKKQKTTNNWTVDDLNNFGKPNPLTKSYTEYQDFINNEIKNNPIPKTYMEKVSNYETPLTLKPLLQSKDTSTLKKALLAIPAAVGSISQATGKTQIGSAFNTGLGGMEYDGTPSQPTGDNKIINFIGEQAGTLGKMARIGNGQSLGFGTTENVINDVLLKNTGKGINSLNKLAQYGISAGSTGAEMGYFSGTESAINGDNVKDVLKATGKGALTGAVLGAGLKGYGDLKTELKAIPKTSELKQRIFEDKFGKMPDGEPLMLSAPKTKPTGGVNDLGNNTNPIIAGGSKETYGTPSKKYTVKNTAIEKAQREYDEGIQIIQNHFKTNKLTQEEIPKIKTELGIDINKLADNLINAKTNVSEIGNNVRLRRIANADYTSFDQNGKPFVTKYPQGKNPLPKLNPNIKKTNVEPVLLKTEKVKVDPNYKNWAGTPKTTVIDSTTTTKGKGSNVPINNKLPQSEATTGGNSLNANIVSGKTKKDMNPVNWIHDLYSKVVDRKHYVNKLDSKGSQGTSSIKVMANNTNSAASQAEHIINGKLINKQGQEIGKGYNEILKNVSKKETEAFNEYLLHKHNINRMAVDKPVFGKNYTADMSKADVIRLEKQYPQFKQISDELNKFMTDFSNEWGVGSGRVTAEGMAKAQEMYPNFVPVYRKGDVNYVPMKNGKNVEGTGNFMKKATGGNSDIIMPTESIQNFINSTVKNARQNEFYNTLLDEVIKNPEKMKAKGISITKTGKETLEELSKIHDMKGISNFEQLRSDAKGGNILTVMKNGEPVSLRINDPKVFKALQDIKTGHIQGDGEKIARSITNPFKEVVTGTNPFFAVRNIVKDMPTSIVNTKNNALTYTKNLITSPYDILTKSKQFKEYQALTGNSSNLINNTLNGKVEKANIFKKFNNFTEVMPRYSEYKTTTNRGGNTYSSKMQGLYDANEISVNFGRSGSVVKTLDSGMPYLNPSVQGLDKFVRNFTDAPIKKIIRGATVMSLPTAILYSINKDNPKYKELDARSKDAYYLIPYGDGFIKMPKSHQMGFIFSTLTERILRQANGEKNAYKGLSGTAKTNFLLPNPVDSNFLSAGTYDVARNKDFANRTIVPQWMKDQNLSPELRSDETTSEISKWFANAIKNVPGVSDDYKSPMVINHIIDAYTGVVGDLLLPATTENGNVGKSIKKQFYADPMYNNQAVTDFYDNYDNLKRIASNKNMNDKLPSKLLTPEEVNKNRFSKAASEISNLNKLIKQTTNEEEIKKYKKQIIDIANKTNKMIK